MSRVPPIGLRISSRTQDAPFLGTSQHYYYDQFKHNFLLNRIVGKLRMLKLFSLPTSKLSGALTHVVLQPELLPLCTLLKAKQYFSFQLLQSKSFFKTKALPAFGSRFILLAGSNRIPHDANGHICCYYFIEQNRELQYLPDEVRQTIAIGLEKSEVNINSPEFQDSKKKNQHNNPPAQSRSGLRLEKTKFFLSNLELGRKNLVFLEGCLRHRPKYAFTRESYEKKKALSKAFFRTPTSNSLKASLFCVGAERAQLPRKKEKAGSSLPASTRNDAGKISFELLKNLCSQPFTLDTGKYAMGSKRNSFTCASGFNREAHYSNRDGVSQCSTGKKNKLFLPEKTSIAVPLPVLNETHQQHNRGKKNAIIVLASTINFNKHKCKLWSIQFDRQLSPSLKIVDFLTPPQCKKDKSKRVTGRNGRSTPMSPLVVGGPCRDQRCAKKSKSFFFPRSETTAHENSGADTPTINRYAHPRFVTQSCSFLKHINIFFCKDAAASHTQNGGVPRYNPVKNKKDSARIPVQNIFLLACLQQLSNSTSPEMRLLSTYYNKHHTCDLRKNRGVSSFGEATPISNLTFFPLPNSQVSTISNSLVLSRSCPKDVMGAEAKKRISQATTLITIDDSEQLLPLMESAFLKNSRYTQYANEDLPRITTNRKVKVKKKNYSFEKWQKQLRNADEQALKNSSSGEALPKVLIHRAFGSPTELHMFALVECALATSKFNPSHNRSFFVRPWKGCLTLCKHETPFQTSICTQPRVDAKLNKCKNGSFRHKYKQTYHAYPESYLWDVRKNLAKNTLEEERKKRGSFFFGIFTSFFPSQAFFLRKLFFFAKLEKERKKRKSLFSNWNSKAQTQLFSSPFFRKQISLFGQKTSLFPMFILIMHKLLVSEQPLRYIAHRKNLFSHPLFLTSRFCPASSGLCRIKAGVLFDLVYPSQIVKQYDKSLKNDSEKKHSFLTHTLKNSKSIVLKKFISIRL